MAKTVREINQHFWMSKNLPHLSIRTTYNSTQGYKAHSHSELSIGIIKSGSTCLTLANEEIILSKNNLVLIPPNMVHACNPVNETARSYHMLYVDNDWCCQILSSLYGYEVSQIRCDQSNLSHDEADAKLVDLICELIKQDSQSLAADVNNQLFNLLSNYCSPQPNQQKADKLAYKIRSRLLMNIANPPSLDDLSKEFARSKESLIRIFKSNFGITPKSFINNNRVEKAKFLLKCGLSIVDVAIDVGFSDQSQLHRAFVNYTASTPRQYQQIRSISDNNSKT